MLLLIGVLHGLNVLSLPVIGRLLGLGHDLVRAPESGASPPDATPRGS